MADRVLVEILQPELDRLKAFMAGEELERCIEVVGGRQRELCSNPQVFFIKRIVT